MEALEYKKTHKFLLSNRSKPINGILINQNENFTCPVTMKPYWSVDVAGITPIISDVEINLHFSANKAIVDSGTSFIVFNYPDF